MAVRQNCEGINNKLFARSDLKPNERITVLAVRLNEHDIIKTYDMKDLNISKNSNCKIIEDQNVYWLISKGPIKNGSELTISNYNFKG